MFVVKTDKLRHIKSKDADDVPLSQSLINIAFALKQPLMPKHFDRRLAAR